MHLFPRITLFSYLISNLTGFSTLKHTKKIKIPIHKMCNFFIHSETVKFYDEGASSFQNLFELCKMFLYALDLWSMMFSVTWKYFVTPSVVFLFFVLNFVAIICAQMSDTWKLHHELHRVFEANFQTKRFQYEAKMNSFFLSLPLSRTRIQKLC